MPRKIIKRITSKEYDYVKKVLDSQFSASAGGLMTKRLEQAFAKLFSSRYAISFINGTATMHAALAAAGVGPGDEVIVPPLTMASTSLAVLHAGALPVFADIDADTWTIDPDSILRNINRRTKAVIPVAIYGLSADMRAIMGIAAKHGLFVLEDDAQCVFGYYKGRIVGSAAHAASFSFQSSKHITSGEGGMVITKDAALAERIRRFNSLGYAAVGAVAGKGKISKDTLQDPAYERHISIGWNYRMPELCAAVALAQLERAEELTRMRIKAAQLYRDALDGCSWLIPQAVPAGYKHAYWTYPLELRSGNVSWHDFRRRYLASGGDAFYAAWQLTYLEPAFLNQVQKMPGVWQKYKAGLCPNAESFQPRAIQLKTNYYDLSQARRQADILNRTIKEFSGRY